MENTTLENAQILETMLGYEDHGIITAYLQLDYGGSVQGFGGYALKEYNSCWHFVRGVLRVTAVDKWEKVRGRYIRVKKESFWNGKILEIGHITQDVWFNPEDIYNEMTGSHERDKAGVRPAGAAAPTSQDTG